MDKISNPEIAAIFAQYPPPIGRKLLTLRRLIIETAAQTAAVEALHETLKWGQPSYLSPIGSTVRLGWRQDTPARYGLYFHCRTNLIQTIRALYGDLFYYEGKRAILFDLDQSIPIKPVKHCIRLALTYHHRKQTSQRKRPI